MKITSLVNNTKLAVKKHAPEITMVTGFVFMGVGAYEIGKQTVKAVDIINKYDAERVELESNIEKALAMNDPSYTEVNADKERKQLTLKKWVSVGKCYIVPVVTELVAVGCFYTSGRMYRKDIATKTMENGALAAAYAVLDASYDKFKNNVANEYGAEAVDKLMTATPIAQMEKNENGEFVVSNKKPDSNEPANKYYDPVGAYDIFFDSGSSKWTNNANENYFFLSKQEQYWDHILRIRGKKGVYLNEVKDSLGLPRTKEGQVVGWIYDPDGNDNGDNYISFGLHEVYSQADVDFIDGSEPVKLLRFNVDGPIIDKVCYSAM